MSDRASSSQSRPLTIVQARMGSTRLPGKTLANIADQTVLERVIGQIRKCDTGIGDVVIATTTNHEDEAILQEAERLHVKWCRWPHPADVLARFVRCHQECERVKNGTVDVVVRVTADCPFLEPSLLDQVIRQIATGSTDYVGVRNAPDGTHAEAFTTEILHAANRWARDPHDREHVVPWIIRNGQCGWIDGSHITGPNLTLDTPEDLERLRHHAQHLATT